MDITKKELKRILWKYYTIADRFDSDEVENVFFCIADILKAEAEATQKKESYAVKYIRDCENAAVLIHDLFYDILDKLDGDDE